MCAAIVASCSDSVPDVVVVVVTDDGANDEDSAGGDADAPVRTRSSLTVVSSLAVAMRSDSGEAPSQWSDSSRRSSRHTVSQTSRP